MNGAAELGVEHDGAVLAGALWQPGGGPRSVVVMHPGSGPSDRDNDGYFPPIRAILLGAGHAVASFDKRGVGASTGAHRTSSIEQQADDLLACVAAIRSRVPGVPVGAFGHSQGGWVAYEAAARGADLDFVISNSGPGVSPAAQTRYELAVALGDGPGAPATLDAFDEVVRHAHRSAPLDAVYRDLGSERLAALGPGFGELTEDDWRLTAALFRYDPAPSLARIGVPVLAIFGSQDRLVPVDESVAALEQHIEPGLLTTAVFDDGDHRLLRDGDLVDGYADRLTRFLARMTCRG